MKPSTLIPLALALSVAVLSISHAQPMKDMDMKGMDAGKKESGTVHKAVGVVKKVDPAKGTITLDHEPVKSLKWSAMTMTFTVKDKVMLQQAQPGKRVDFEFVQQGKDYQITSLK